MGVIETDWIRVRVQADGRINVSKRLREYHGVMPGDTIDVKLRNKGGILEEPERDSGLSTPTAADNLGGITNLLPSGDKIPMKTIEVNRRRGRAE